MKKVYCAVCGQEILEDEKAVLIFDQTTDEATLAVCDRCASRARVISDQERAELTKYQDEEDEDYD